MCIISHAPWPRAGRGKRESERERERERERGLTAKLTAAASMIGGKGRGGRDRGE